MCVCVCLLVRLCGVWCFLPSWSIIFLDVQLDPCRGFKPHSSLYALLLSLKVVTALCRFVMFAGWTHNTTHHNLRLHCALKLQRCVYRTYACLYLCTCCECSKIDTPLVCCAHLHLLTSNLFSTSSIILVDQRKKDKQDLMWCECP